MTTIRHRYGRMDRQRDRQLTVAIPQFGQLRSSRGRKKPYLHRDIDTTRARNTSSVFKTAAATAASQSAVTETNDFIHEAILRLASGSHPVGNVSQ